MKYSPKRVTGLFQPNVANGPSIPFLAFMDDTFIEVEFDEDAVTKHVGVQGDVTYVLNADKTATLKIVLAQGSVTNAQLSKYVPDARRNYMPTGMLSFRDLDGSTVASDHNAVIKKMTPIKYGKTVIGREWTFILSSAEINAGGSES